MTESFLALTYRACTEIVELTGDSSVLCSVCEEENLPGRTRCGSCLSPLQSISGFSEAERQELAARIVQSKRKRKRIKIVSTIFALLLIAILVTYNSLNIRLFKSEASSDVNSIYGPGDSAMFQRDFGRTGYVAVAGWTPRLEAEWTFETDAPFLSSPAVVGKMLYASTGDSRIVALNADSGDLLWQKHTTGPIDSSPTVAGDLVYVGLRDRRILALDRNTGVSVWEFEAGGWVSSSSVVKDGFIYFGSGDGNIYALDANSAEVMWTYQTDDGIASSISIDDDILTVGSRDRHIYVLDLKTGRHRAIFQTPSRVENAPVIANGDVYVSTSSGTVRAFEVTARELPFEKAVRRIWAQLWVWQMAPTPPFPNSHRWISSYEGMILGNMAIGDGRLYLPHSEGILNAVDTETGKSLWKFDTGHDKLRSTPLIVGDTVLIGASNGILYGLDSDTGYEKWRFPTGGEIRTAPVFANDTLYLASGDGILYAIK